MAEVPSLLTRAEVEEVTGLSRSMIYARMREEPPTFPVPLKIGRAVRWRADELIEWMNGLERATGDLA